MSDASYVRLIDARKTYLWGPRRVTALESITCSVFPGDRIAVLGPSGSGKSTLLHLLGGVDSPSEGVAQWPTFGPRDGLRPRFVSYVFQTKSLVDSLTAEENVALPLVLMGMTQSEAQAIAEAALASFGLEEVAQKLPEELSGGQAQRVAVARAVAARPRLILADEPTGQLDHPTAGRLFDALFAALDGTDTALVVATHDAAIATRMARRWAMHYGMMEVLS